MKARPPIGVIRPLATLLGGARRRWRSGPLVPMIWRRRLRARPVPSQGPVHVAPAAPANVFNLNLVWPAGTAARIATLCRYDTRLRETVRAGQGPAPLETSRLVTLVERLWLHPGKDGAATTAVSMSVHGQSVPPSFPRANPQSEPHIPAEKAAPAPRALAPLLWRRAPADRAPLSRPRTWAIRHGAESRAAQPPARIAAFAAPLTRRATAARADAPHIQTRPRPLPSALLVWRKEAEGGEAFAGALPQANGGRSSTDLVWRRPARASARSDSSASLDVGERTALRGAAEGRADRPFAAQSAAPAVSSAAAIQPAEMGRLVDEVVRRLDRIGRDERMRRGL